MYSYRKPLKKEEETCCFFCFFIVHHQARRSSLKQGLSQGLFGGAVGQTSGPTRPERTREEEGCASKPFPAIVQSAKVNFFAQLFKQVAWKPGCCV